MQPKILIKMFHKDRTIVDFLLKGCFLGHLTITFTKLLMFFTFHYLPNAFMATSILQI